MGLCKSKPKTMEDKAITHFFLEIEKLISKFNPEKDTFLLRTYFQIIEMAANHGNPCAKRCLVHYKIGGMWEAYNSQGH